MVNISRSIVPPVIKEWWIKNGKKMLRLPPPSRESWQSWLILAVLASSGFMIVRGTGAFLDQ